MQRRINLMLLVVFLLGLTLAGYIFVKTEDRLACEQLRHNAELLMDFANVTREYTGEEVLPLLFDGSRANGEDGEFIQQMVPSYASRRAVEKFMAIPAESTHNDGESTSKPKYAGYNIKEIAKIPHNQQHNRAEDWEVGLIRRLTQNPESEIFEKVDLADQHLYVLAKPIVFEHRELRDGEIGCLACHGEDRKPSSMLNIADYAQAGNFGWKPNNVVGAQVVTVPVEKVNLQVRARLLTFALSMIGVFTLMYLVVNVGLRRSMVGPLQDVVTTTDRVSKGETGIPEFPEHEKGEIGSLKAAINRLRRSLDMAIAEADRAKSED